MTLQRFEVGDRPRLEVRISSGRVDVETGEPGRAEISLEGRAVDVGVQRSGDTILVGRPDTGMAAGGRVRVQARVPEGTMIEIATASATVWLSGSFGASTVKTASGNVSVERASQLTVRSASGDVRAEEVGGDLDVSTASGDVLVGVVGGRLSVASMSGDVRVEAVEGAVGVTTASGDIRIERASGDELRLKSVSGDISIGLHAGTRVDANITTLSGRIRMPEPEQRSGEPRREVALSARSVSGDVSIRRL